MRSNNKKMENKLLKKDNTVPSEETKGVSENTDASETIEETAKEGVTEEEGASVIEEETQEETASEEDSNSTENSSSKKPCNCKGEKHHNVNLVGYKWNEW
jgi:hypothetical protein